jgi:hypothetical protein
MVLGGRIRNSNFLEIASKLGTVAALAKPFDGDQSWVVRTRHWLTWIRARRHASCRIAVMAGRTLTAERHEGIAAELRLIARPLSHPDNVRTLLAQAQELDAKAAEIRQRRTYYSATRDI